MIRQVEITLKPQRRGCHLVTDEIVEQIGQLPETGLVNIFLKHTSCALTLNENFDPHVRSDMNDIYNRLVPEGTSYYRHTDEGEDDMPSHFKSTMTGVSLTIPVSRGQLNLGTWQGIYLCEFRNFGGSRHIIVTIMS